MSYVILISPKLQEANFYQLHFTNEETEAQKGPKVIYLSMGWTEIGTQSV